MAAAETITGRPFTFSGSLSEGLEVFFKPPHKMKINRKTVDVVRHEISKRSPVRMGANRKPLVADSVGETLALDHGVTPQAMSYLLPLLIEEGFCTATRKKPIIIYKA